jgi:putative DNA primase/helicase
MENKQASSKTLPINHVRKRIDEDVLKYRILKDILEKVKREDYYQILEIDQFDGKGQPVKISPNLYAIGQCRAMKQYFDESEKNAIATDGKQFFYAYTGTHYEVIDNANLKVFIRYFAHKSGVYHLYADSSEYQKKVLENAFNFFILPGADMDRSKRFLNLQNGTLIINSNPEFDDKGKVKEDTLFKKDNHNKNDFLKHCNEYEFNPDATCEKWEQFLRDVIKLPSYDGSDVTIDSPVNEANIKAIQEAFGYVLYSGSNPPKIFVFSGDGNNGKSVVNQVAHNLFGKDNVEGFTTGEISEEYYRAKLVGKLLNYPAENDESGQIPAVLKAMASREKVSYRSLFNNPEQSDNWPRIFLNQNSENRIVERAHGFWRRFFVIDFLVNIPPEKENKELANEILEEELPGILNWALAGLKRFHEQGKRFTESEQSKTSVDNWKKSGDSVQLFMEEFCLIPGKYGEAQNLIEYKDLWDNFFNWQKQSGFKLINKSTFKTRLVKDLKIPFGKVKGSNKNAFYVACTNINGESELEVKFEKKALPIIQESTPQPEPPKPGKPQKEELPF